MWAVGGFLGPDRYDVRADERMACDKTDEYG